MTEITLTPVRHPSPEVRRAGFALDSAYVEACWTPYVGTLAVAVLRRLPEWWRREPWLTADVADLGARFGVGGGTGKNAPICRTLDRLVRFRAAEWRTETDLAVYTTLPPLSRGALSRMPQAVRDDHDFLLASHLDVLAVPA